MNKTQERALVKETKALIKEVESGDTDHAAWVAIRDRVMQLREVKTVVEVAEALDKKATWVKDVSKWDARVSTPFARDAAPYRRSSVQQAEAKKVLRDPEQREKVIEALTEEERDDLQEDLWKREAATNEEDLARATRQNKKRDHNEAAERATERALDALKARMYYYGDIPISDHEEQELKWVVQLAQGLLGETALDDELKEILNA